MPATNWPIIICINLLPAKCFFLQYNSRLSYQRAFYFFVFASGNWSSSKLSFAVTLYSVILPFFTTAL